jgi:uncharacterized cofD-like protein
LVSSPKVAVVGGGTGTFTALVGLKHYALDLTAIVSMADDGGSSGRLRDEFGHLPPGDVRRCLLALSSDDTSLTLRRLFDYRFNRGSGLNGHSFGNLLLTALTELAGATDLAIAEAAVLLGVQGTVLPITLSDSRLCAVLENGAIIRGESSIDIRTEHPDYHIQRVYLDPPSKANPAALAAIEQADALVIGPGDLYTSIVPNLLVDGVSEAINSSRAVKIYVCNLLTKHGETDGYQASDFVREIQRYLGVTWSLDHVIVNDSSNFPEDLLQRYALERAFPVTSDVGRCASLGPQPHYYPLAAIGSLLRHDSLKLARVIFDIVTQHASRQESRQPLQSPCARCRSVGPHVCSRI